MYTARLMEKNEVVCQDNEVFNKITRHLGDYKDVYMKMMMGTSMKTIRHSYQQ